MIIMWNTHLNSVTNIIAPSCDTKPQGMHLLGRPLFDNELIITHAKDKNYYISCLLSYGMHGKYYHMMI